LLRRIENVIRSRSRQAQEESRERFRTKPDQVKRIVRSSVRQAMEELKADFVPEITAKIVAEVTRSLQKHEDAAPRGNSRNRRHSGGGSGVTSMSFTLEELQDSLENDLSNEALTFLARLHCPNVLVVR